MEKVVAAIEQATSITSRMHIPEALLLTRTQFDPYKHTVNT